MVSSIEKGQTKPQAKEKYLISQGFASKLNDVTKRAMTLVLKSGTPFSTNEGFDISGSSSNKGLHFFDGGLRLGIELIDLDNKIDGKKLLKITSSEVSGPWQYHNEVARIILNEDTIEDVPVFVERYKWVEKLIEFADGKVKLMMPLRR